MLPIHDLGMCQWIPKRQRSFFCHGNILLKNIDVHRSGQILILVFLESGFPKNHSKAIYSSKVIPKKSEMIIPVKVPCNMGFSIKVLHDEDSNNRVTKNWTGVWPREGLGFSNGAMLGTLGPPDFDAAKVLRKDAINKGIKMRVTYP